MTSNSTAPLDVHNTQDPGGDVNTLQPEPRIVAIVPAGGVGQRASSGLETPVPKQYRTIREHPMLRVSVQALLGDSQISQVYVSVQADDGYAQSAICGLDRVRVTRTAGQTRALTVLNTIDMLLEHKLVRDVDWVLVHDAARPGLPLDALRRLVSACLESGWGGLLALPATDTVKLAAPQSTVASRQLIQTTIDRNRVWLAQTPQMYRARVLQQALAGAIASGFDVTDESSAIEWAGQPSQLVRGDVANFKVTWPEDFEMIERYVK
ncbi:IspD/TarI family cytidylyltransferase [Orrella marina]|uniref:2-C-methyl-D-erythritol 4-phosphate cytidylyltransferase n=1 Tax=Orrella marina TaxID=2163011 RepID=A0A2R4XK42_9BURK|nr:2-C-methyl-D-erythritol 4-phosphate cytidylyltransferase [Orrella marina]AWB34069.1 2-C-methyl-D-erythritol 4-phosphate cytidylyltransferase [Orrella marina]